MERRFKQKHKQKQEQNYSHGANSLLNFLKIKPFNSVLKNVAKPAPTLEVLDISNVVLRTEDIEKAIHSFREVFIVEENNYTVYKRSLSKLMPDIHKGHGLLVAFRGPRGGGKTYSLIGSISDPGMLPVFMLELMQQKYAKQSSEFKVMISFLEYRDDKFFDLLVCTHIPLHRRGENSFFPLSVFEINQFLEFLRLFKIALFYNKARDISVASLHASRPTLFIGKVTIIHADSSGLLRSEITFLDFDNCEHYDPRTLAKGVENPFTRCLYEMKEAANSPHRKAPVNFGASSLTRFLKSSLQHSYLAVYSCISENESLDILQAEIKFMKEASKVANRKEPTIVKSSVDGISQQKEHTLHQIQVVVDYIRLSEYSRFSELLRTKELLREHCARLLRTVEQCSKSLGQLMTSRLKLYSQQAYLVNFIKEKVAKLIKNSNIKEFYSAKTYGSLELEIKSSSESILERVKQLVRELVDANGRLEEGLVQLKRFTHSVEDTDLREEVKAGLRTLASSYAMLLGRLVSPFVLNDQGYDFVQLLRLSFLVEGVGAEVLQQLRLMTVEIGEMDTSILNCYKDSYLNDSLSIVTKVKSQLQFEHPSDWAESAPPPLKFKRLASLPKIGRLPPNVLYLKDFLRQRGQEQELLRKYKEVTGNEAGSSRLSEQESLQEVALDVIEEEKVKRRWRAKKTFNKVQRIEYATEKGRQTESVVYVSKLQ